ncbi:RCC1 domain-containing protein [Nannocystis pusilla]|uniref:RCC1-like domain-containing protein n=1 Tax=Nannocystis pusilla TaxID=889268 RepID=A0ABS7U414_9BACT|nr:RCC1 domain-containing protein [Nannocystis pusilla]MBZ5715303.1 hypothetical protein [Nannocystis pusilla]
MRLPRLAILLVLAACADRGRDAGRDPSPGIDDATFTAAPGPTLALGVGHTCALARGEVFCWGYGGHGQLGLGDRDDRLVPTRVPDLADVVALAAGTWHTCALRRGGDVLCWGDGSLGQLGDGALGTRPRPSRVAELRAAALAAGGSHTCAIDHVRKVLCWGSNHRGESGPGGAPLLRPAVVPGAPAADALAVGDAYACALAGGAVTCWGVDPLRDGRDPAPAPLPALRGAVSLAAGADHLCVVTGAGRVLCIGTGSEGQLGDGRPPELRAPRGPHAIGLPEPRRSEVLDLADAAAVAVGDDFACARRRSGALACWGENRDGQLGDGARARRDRPGPVGEIADAVELVVGSAHACARLADGALRCWGYNEFAQAGERSREPATPTATHALAATGLAVGEAHACAWSDGGAWCWGDGAYGQLGDGARVRRDVSTPVPDLGRVRELVAGARHTCALEHGGTVMCWGDDTFGQLAGRGVPTGEPVDEHTGPLPLPPIEARSRPRPGPVDGLADVVDLATYGHRTCAARSDGAIVCWHAWNDAPLSQERTIAGAVEVAVGAAHTCARTAAGAVRCWGANHSGRLGDGTTESRPDDVAVRGLDDAVALAAGRLHTCALRRGGEVVCWGDGLMGQLGDGSRADRATPTAVLDLGRARAIAASEDTTCAIGQATRVLCWGAGDAGQLGPAGGGGRFAPVVARASAATRLAVGARTACSSDGERVTCWGEGLSPRASRHWDVIATPRAIALP